MIEKKIIWQPELFLQECGFKVSLDQDFARDMIKTPLSREGQRGMNELAVKDLKSLRINWPTPYTFHKESCLINQIYLGSNGVWLSTCHTTLNHLLKSKDSYEKYIEYDSHNVDTPRNAYALLYLFSKWVEYTDVLKGLNQNTNQH